MNLAEVSGVWSFRREQVTFLSSGNILNGIFVLFVTVLFLQYRVWSVPAEWFNQGVRCGAYVINQ